jgi:nitrogen fixation NifU-like protein
MADNEKARLPSQPVTLHSDFTRAELEQVIARKVSRRFSLTALRAALFPAHQGAMDQPDGFAHEQGACGDLITFYLRIKDDRVQKVTFTTDGCDATIAVGEMLSSMVTDMSVDEVERVTPDELLVALGGLPPNHIHCADLAVETLRKAVASYQEDFSS